MHSRVSIPWLLLVWLIIGIFVAVNKGYGDIDNGSELATKVIRPIWLGLQDEIMTRLDDVTIEDLCAQANQRGVVSEGRENLDFTI